MTVDKYNLCSRALIELGKEPIESFDDGTDISTTCGVIYEGIITSILSMHNWKFARKKQQLTKLSDTPVNEYQCAYQLPSDLLVLRAVYASNQVGVKPHTQFELFGDNQLYTNATALWGEYTYYPAEDKWPAYFQNLIVMALKAALCAPVTEKLDVAVELHRDTFGSPSDNYSGGFIAEAKRIDSQQQPNQRPANNPIIEAMQ